MKIKKTDKVFGEFVIAALNNDLKTVKHLLPKIDDLQSKNIALSWAVPSGNLEVVKFLIKHGASVNTPGLLTGVPGGEHLRNKYKKVSKDILNKRKQSYNNFLGVIIYLVEQGISWSNYPKLKHLKTKKEFIAFLEGLKFKL